MNTIAQLLVGFLLLWGCGNPVRPVADDGLDPIEITDIAPASLQLDPFDLNSVTVSADTLKLSISYSGGCSEHDFDLFMSPAAFMESFPAQANLFLRHNGNDDACDAYITNKIFFNLQPVSTLYQQMYGKKEQIILNVFEFFTDKPGDHIPGDYFP